MPAGLFDLVLCRYAAFTYFDTNGQHEFARRLARKLYPGGALVLGKNETLPVDDDRLSRPDLSVPIYRAARGHERPTNGVTNVG
jgi:chemotaxis protein methyltransferase CheR